MGISATSLIARVYFMATFASVHTATYIAWYQETNISLLINFKGNDIDFYMTNEIVYYYDNILDARYARDW